MNVALSSQALQKKNFEKRFISINCHMHELLLSGDHSLDVCTFGAAAWHFSSGSSSLSRRFFSFFSKFCFSGSFFSAEKHDDGQE